VIYFTVRIVAERAGFDPDATWRVLGDFWVNNGMQSPKKPEKQAKKTLTHYVRVIIEKQ
jgi:hypothetical protein